MTLSGRGDYNLVMAPPPRTLAARLTDLVARRYLKKPDQAELLRIKFPDARSIGWAAWNEAMFRTRKSRGGRLTTLNVEITNRCNLRCVYCPVNRDLARPKTEMPFEAFVDLLDRSPTVETLLPFQWGEPLLHPRWADMLRAAKARGIRTFLTTNGTFLGPAERRAILDSGVVRLTVSVDGDDAIHRRTRGVELAPIRERVGALRRERDAAGSRLRIDVSMVVDAQTEGALDAYRAAWTPVVDRVQAIPRMVTSDAPRSAPCREPWRGLLVVLADGTATTCCADSEGALDLGNAFEHAPAELLAGERMAALRRAHARREFPDVCAGCGEHDHPSVSARFR